MVQIRSSRVDGRPRTPPSPFSGAIGALALAVVACGEVTAPLPSEGPPRTLSFSTGSYFTGNTSWSLRGDTVVFERDTWQDGGFQRYVARAVPTAAAWRTFWSEAGSAGVDRWRDSYVNETIADGEGWRLVLETSASRIESGGYSAYPDAEGRKRDGERTAEFRVFLASLYMLVGQQEGM